MLIAIISDTHDNIANLEKALRYINRQKIKVLIHCGDLCSPAVLKRVIEPHFKGEIYLIHGNISDRERLEDYAIQYNNVKTCGDRGEIKIDNKKIAFVHFPQEAKDLARTGKYDLVFYGHTHRPWEEKLKIENRKLKIVRLINPGTLAGMFYKATFALYDSKQDQLELKILEKI